MAATAAEIPRERDLLSRLAAGTAGVVGAAFLRRLVAELAGALDARWPSSPSCASTARAGRARSPAPASRVELREGSEFELAGTPCEHAYQHELLLVRRGARLRYPEDSFLREHQLDGYLAIALRAADGRAIGHMGVICSRHAGPGAERAAGAARLRRARRRRARAPPPRARAQGPRRRGRRLARPRRPGRRRRAPPDRARPARRRPAAARRARPGAGARAARRSRTTPRRPLARLPARARAGRRREPRAARAGARPAPRRARARPRGALAALAAQSPLPLRIAVAARPAPARRSSRRRSGSSSPRRSPTRSSTPPRPSCACPPSSTGARSSPRSPTTAPAAPAPTRGTGLQGLAARVESLGGRLPSRARPAQGTTLTATIPLAPWRTSAEPYLEFGHDGDGGRGPRKIEELLAGTRTTGVSLAREWELEGGPPRIGQRLPVYDHTGRRHGFVEICRRGGQAVRRDRPGDDRPRAGRDRLARGPRARL